MLAARVDRGELRAHLFAERGQRVRLDTVLARESADVEQPRLDLLQPVGIERQRVGGAGDPVLRFARFDQRPVERGERFGQQRMVGRAALDPPSRLSKQRQRAVRTAEQLVEPRSAIRPP